VGLSDHINSYRAYLSCRDHNRTNDAFAKASGSKTIAHADNHGSTQIDRRRRFQSFMIIFFSRAEKLPKDEVPSAKP
jgi:hypothetical protein